MREKFLAKRILALYNRKADTPNNEGLNEEETAQKRNRRGRIVAECARLESGCPVTGIEGSNPSLSASGFWYRGKPKSLEYN